MKKGLILLAVAAAGLASCGGGFKQGPGGMLYNIHEDKSGTAIKEGDFISVNMIVKTEGDSVLSSTYESGIPTATLMPKSQMKGDIVSGISMLSEGDSATYKINIDSTSQKGAPKPPFKGKYIVFQVKVLKVVAKGNLTEQVFQDRCKAYFTTVIDGVKKAEPGKIAKFIDGKGLKAIKTASGLNYVITKTTTGQMPVAGDTVVMHYTGRLMGKDKFFETSVKETAMQDKKTYNPQNPYNPIRFPIGEHKVIAGWDEGILLMHKGEKATLIIPSALAYGEQGMNPVIPPFATLVFDLELMDIVKPNPNAKPAPPMPQPPVQAQQQK